MRKRLYKILHQLQSFMGFLYWYCQGKPNPPEWEVNEQGPSTVYTGFFAVRDCWGRVHLSVRGRVVEWSGLPTDVYLYDPPLSLRKHSHGSCLQLLRPGESWFKLHWQRPARDFGTTCAYVEQLLHEVSQV
jgi:hypothetical protein